MIEMLTAWAIQNAVVLAGGSIAAAILTFILKKIPTAKVRKWIYDISFGIGAAISKFFTNWKYTKMFWENTLEPWLIGFLDMLLMSIINGLFDGLRSDNEKK